MQMLTVSQNAIWTVAAYPTLVSAPLLEALAQVHAEPSMSELLGHAPSPEQSLNWKHVTDYVHSITVHNMTTYVPFLPTVKRQMLCAS